MANNQDDDLLAGPVPEPEAEATASERAHAKTFGELVDKTLAGRTPAAMTADDRALLEAATVIRAASGNVELPAARVRSAVEDALHAAIGGKGGPASGSGVTPIERARARRWAPWAIAATTTLVAAAAILLWLRAPAKVVTIPAAAQIEIPTTWRSRPADPLIGAIPRERAADASTRIDTIFADRLDGYRERRLRGGKP
ncbi:MAG: hypothetical protein ACM31C_23525 [Acidobacteriota bacterium]